MARGKGAATRVDFSLHGADRPVFRDDDAAGERRVPGRLGSPVIGDRVGKPADRDRRLPGEPWFYYGSRYGEYLALARQPNAADYLPAMLEATPGNAEATTTSPTTTARRAIRNTR